VILDAVGEEPVNALFNAVLKLTSADDPKRLTRCDVYEVVRNSPAFAGATAAVIDLVTMRLE